MPTLDKRDRQALLKNAGVVMSDQFFRQCLSGNKNAPKMGLENARKIVRTWRDMRAVLQPIYKDLPEIRLTDLINHAATTETAK